MFKSASGVGKILAILKKKFKLNFISECVIIFTIDNHVLVTKEREIAT